MVRRRLIFAAGAMLVAAGCGERSRSSTQSRAQPLMSSPTTAAQIDSRSVTMETPRAIDLVRHARATFTTTNASGQGQPVLGASHATSFVADGSMLRALAKKADPRAPIVRLPKLADGALTVDSGEMHVEVRPIGFAPRGIEWGDRIAIYADVEPGVHAFRRVVSD